MKQLIISNDLSQTIENLFQIKLTKIENFVREDQDSVINCFLTDETGDQFFLKEVQTHSLREGMDETYRQLHTVHSSAFRLILPMEYDTSKFLFGDERKKFLLFHQEKLKEFNSDDIGFETFLDVLDEMHNKISKFHFPWQSHRTFAGWIEMGLAGVLKKYGESIPFISRFEKFMKERYHKLNLATGNIHWDIHKSNVCLDEYGKLVILDVDLMQKGEFACDLSRAAFMYSSQEKLRFALDPKIVELATERIRKKSPAVTVQDIKFFISRTPLGAMRSSNYPLTKNEAIAYLQSLDEFVGNSHGNF